MHANYCTIFSSLGEFPFGGNLTCFLNGGLEAIIINNKNEENIPLLDNKFSDAN